MEIGVATSSIATAGTAEHPVGKAHNKQDLEEGRAARGGRLGLVRGDMLG
jgi:hypothetical protein